MKGYVDQVEGNRIIGWCAPAVPGTPAMVSVQAGGDVLVTARADIERKDVEEAGICEARCGFELMLPLQVFERHGMEFSIALERMDDGEVLADAVSINVSGGKWTWSPADLAVLVKKWHEASAVERRETRHFLAKFDIVDLVAALMQHGFFAEVEAAIAARRDTENAAETWFVLSDERCSDVQIKSWAFGCRLKEAGARARTAMLEAEFLDGFVMPAFREALASDIVEPSDWLVLLDLFALCPAADSLDEIVDKATEFLAVKNSGEDPFIEACLRHELMRPPVDAIDADKISMPAKDGEIWPRFRIDELEKTVSLTLFLFIGKTSLAQDCHESVSSILNQGARGLRLIIIGYTDLIVAKTRERLDRCKGVEVCFFPGDPERTDLIRESVDKITGEHVGWLETGELLGPGVLQAVAAIFCQNQNNPVPAAAVFDAATFTGARVISSCSAAHLARLSKDRLVRIEDDWLDHKFLSDGWLLVPRDVFVMGLNTLPDLVGIDALQYAVLYAATSSSVLVHHCSDTGLFRPVPIQPIEPGHTREILQQAEQRSVIVKEAIASPEAEMRLHTLLRKHFASDEPRITIMSSRLGKIFSSDTSREIREHFAALGYQANFVEEINPSQIVPGQLILVLVHQYGVESDLIPALAKRFPDCPMIGWFWDNHHQGLGNVEIARHFHACIAAHDFCRDILASRRNVLLPSVPLCVTQWTAAEAKSLFAKYGNGERSKALYGGFVRYATAARRNEFVTALQNHLDPHALSLVDEFNLAAYFALPAEERFAEWCRYRTSLCLPLFRDLSQRFFDALLCGQVPVVTDDIADLAKVVQDYPGLAKRFEVLRGHDIVGIEDVLEGVHQRSKNDSNISPLEQHNYALNHHMLQNRLDTILATLKTFTEST